MFEFFFKLKNKHKYVNIKMISFIDDGFIEIESKNAKKRANY